MKKRNEKGILVLFVIIGIVALTVIALNINKIEKSYVDWYFADYTGKVAVETSTEEWIPIKDDPRIVEVQITFDNGDTITTEGKNSFIGSDKKTRNLNQLYSSLIGVGIMTLGCLIALTIVICEDKHSEK